MSDSSANAAAPAVGSSQSRDIAELIGKGSGLILVVGGGMSVPTDLAALDALGLKPSVIVSANGHAVKAGLKPDYIVCKDDVHTETGEKMEELLRPIGAPIVSPQSWADIRLRDWPIDGNSGIYAIAFAVLLGGHPVVPIGFDFYLQGTYWHDPDAPNISRKSAASRDYLRRVVKLERWTRGAAIRPLSGPLLKTFPRLGAFYLPPRRRPPIEEHYTVFGNESRRERDRRILRQPAG